MSEERLAYVTGNEPEGGAAGDEMTPAGIAASHARHYAALLTLEEEGSAGWQFVFGQLSAAAALSNALQGRRESGPDGRAVPDARPARRPPDVT